MDFLGKKEDTIFIGQAVEVPGTVDESVAAAMDTNGDGHISAEEMQMGMSLGLAMDGNVPISIFPRWNFLLCGINQLVNHIDKFKSMAGNKFKPKIIIRTSVGSQRPLHPQFQHVGDFSSAIQKMCTTIEVVKLIKPDDIFSSYRKAYERKDGKNTIIVEYGDYYSEK